MKVKIFTQSTFIFFKEKFLVFAALLIFPVLAFAQFPYSETFQNSTAPSVNFSGNPTPAYLTSGVSDPVGSGYLRLTSNSLNQAGTAFSSAIFPSNNGLTASFEYYMYGGTALTGKTGDGFSFFLFDASVSTANFRTGANGGALGYAQKENPAIKGVSKGYIGIGFDAFGNFSNPSDGRNGGPGVVPSAVVIRGPGDGSSKTADYPYVAGQATNVAPFNFPLATATRDPYPTASNYRKAIVEMTPVITGTTVTGFTINVKIVVGGSTPTTYTIISNQAFNYPPPPYLKFGFSGSTGSASDYHDIRNFTITVRDINGLTPPTVNDDNYTGCLNTPVYFDPTVNDETPNDGNLNNPGENINKASIDFDFNTPGLQQTKIVPGKGTFSANANGVVTFTPVTGFSGIVDCDYYISDTYGKEAVNPGTIHVNVSTNTAPSLTVNSPQTTCSPSFVDLTASPGVWSASPGGGTTGYYYDILGDSAIATPSHVDTNGTYFIQYTIASTGCKVVDSVQVTISSATNTPTPVNNFNCGTGSVALSATGAGAGEDYKWYSSASGGQTLQVGGATFNTPVISITTNYWVSKYNTKTQGCESNRVKVVATINPPATVANAGPDQTVNNVNSISLTGNVPANGETGAWSFVSGPNTPTVLNPTDNNATVTNILAGTYVFSWKIQRGTCFSEDEVTITVGSVLPVTLISFDGTLRSKVVYLQWSTATEINNDHFEVEKSADGINFSSLAKIGYVHGNGNSNIVHNYSYQDNVANLTQPLVYYRLKQVDADGASAYSNVVLIHLSNAGVSVLVFPNPFNSNVRIQGNFATSGKVNLLVSDMNGRIISKQNLVISQGFNDIPVYGLQHLSSGLYTVELYQNKNRIYSTKLVKQ